MQPTDPEIEPTPNHINSVDATIGQPMVARVLARKLELETLLAALPDEDRHGEISHALSSISGLLTGDLTNVPAVVVSNMNTWLESSKHIAEQAVAPALPMDQLETDAEVDATPEA
jgi:hypothetical protein